MNVLVKNKMDQGLDAVSLVLFRWKKEVLVVSLLASLLPLPRDGGREGFWTSRLSTSCIRFSLVVVVIVLLSATSCILLSLVFLWWSSCC